MRSNYVLGLGSHGFHRLHYTEWGDPDNARVLICVHGLTRNGRDFDMLASALQDVYRVVCPDLPGRGQSDWLPDKADYGYALYLNDMTVLIARLNVAQVDWLGTSMGGLIGMLLAAYPNTPIRRMVVNDIGPVIPQAAIDRIGRYVGLDLRFQDLQTLETYLRSVHAPFGDLTNAHWWHLVEHSTRRLPNGEYALHYDPKIGESFLEQAGSIELWKTWEAIRCPVRVLRGQSSDVLLPEIAAQMKLRGPKAEVVEFHGCGHAPALMGHDQIRAVREWLLQGE